MLVSEWIEILQQNRVTNSPCWKEAISEVQYFPRISLVSISDFSSNRATRHARSRRSFFSLEFQRWISANEGTTRYVRAVTAACFDFLAIGSIIKISRTFHEGRALTSGTAFTPPRSDDRPRAVTMAFWFSFIFTMSCQTYNPLFAYFRCIAR